VKRNPVSHGKPGFFDYDSCSSRSDVHTPNLFRITATSISAARRGDCSWRAISPNSSSLNAPSQNGSRVPLAVGGARVPAEVSGGRVPANLTK
jgi:hypothetical protein